ncbi:MAG: DUF4383 domain-containing protein [Gemmatimonadaceae bacterium]
MSSTFATILGAFLLVEGIWGMFSPVVFGVLSTNWLHAGIHIVLGLIGIYVGMKGGAKPFLTYVGALLIVVGVLRFVPGVNDFLVSLLNVNYPVAYFNIVVGIISIIIARTSRSAATST